MYIFLNMKSINVIFLCEFCPHFTEKELSLPYLSITVTATHVAVDEVLLVVETIGHYRKLYQ